MIEVWVRDVSTGVAARWMDADPEGDATPVVDIYLNSVPVERVETKVPTTPGRAPAFMADLIADRDPAQLQQVAFAATAIMPVLPEETPVEPPEPPLAA